MVAEEYTTKKTLFTEDYKISNYLLVLQNYYTHYEPSQMNILDVGVGSGQSLATFESYGFQTDGLIN